MQGGSAHRHSGSQWPLKQDRCPGGCTMSNKPLPVWELVLSAAARLQQILPHPVLVGGTASALYAAHRVSADADHVLTD